MKTVSIGYINMYNSLTTIFECPIEYFFQYMVKNADENLCNDYQYYNSIKKYADSVQFPDFPWSSTYAIKEVVERIPSGSVLQMAINNSIRISYNENLTFEEIDKFIICLFNYIDLLKRMGDYENK